MFYVQKSCSLSEMPVNLAELLASQRLQRRHRTVMAPGAYDKIVLAL